jgi:hypothetical protein
LGAYVSVDGGLDGVELVMAAQTFDGLDVVSITHRG